MARIALVNAPFRSHVAAMVRLADVLGRRGHQVIVWAPAEWRDDVSRLGGRLEISSPSLPHGPGRVPLAELASTAEHEAERLIPQLHAHDVDLLIRDSQTPWALVAAEYLGIPRIVAHPMFPMPDPVAAFEPHVAERARLEERRLSIARRWGVELADVRGLHHRTSEATLLFTTEEVLGDRELRPSWRCIGPLLPPPPPRRPHGAEPLVYACFGTAQNRRTELFRLVISAAARLPVRLLVSAGGRRLTREDLGPLPSNVAVRTFVPSREALASASVHVTHGGCNSVHESLVAGVPMVCLPQAFDQAPLSRRVVELGVGVIAEEDPRAVADALVMLLVDREARARTRALGQRLLRYDGEIRVAAAIAEQL